jgi:hypothetical protein
MKIASQVFCVPGTIIRRRNGNAVYFWNFSFSVLEILNVFFSPMRPFIFASISSLWDCTDSGKVVIVFLKLVPFAVSVNSSRVCMAE